MLAQIVNSSVAYNSMGTGSSNVFVGSRTPRLITINNNRPGLVAGTRGAQFTPAGVLLLPIEGDLGAGAILQALSNRLEKLRRQGGQDGKTKPA